MTTIRWSTLLLFCLMAGACTTNQPPTLPGDRSGPALAPLPAPVAYEPAIEYDAAQEGEDDCPACDPLIEKVIKGIEALPPDAIVVGGFCEEILLLDLPNCDCNPQTDDPLMLEAADGCAEIQDCWPDARVVLWVLEADRVPLRTLAEDPDGDAAHCASCHGSTPSDDADIISAVLYGEDLADDETDCGEATSGLGPY